MPKRYVVCVITDSQTLYIRGNATIGKENRFTSLIQDAKIYTKQGMRVAVAFARRSFPEKEVFEKEVFVTEIEKPIIESITVNGYCEIVGVNFTCKCGRKNLIPKDYEMFICLCGKQYSNPENDKYTPPSKPKRPFIEVTIKDSHGNIDR